MPERDTRRVMFPEKDCLSFQIEITSSANIGRYNYTIHFIV